MVTLFVWQWIVQFCMNSAEYVDHLYSRDQSLNSKLFDTGLLWNTTARSEIDCANTCSAHAECLAFSHHRYEHRCLGYQCQMNTSMPSTQYSNMDYFEKVAECQNALIVLGATVTGSGTTMGSTRTVACDMGYVQTVGLGPVTSTCQADGQWSIPDINCTIVECRDALVVFGAIVTGSGTTMESNRTVTCDAGYEQTVGFGPVNSTCQADGQWSIPDIKCTKCTRFGSTFTLRQNMFIYSPLPRSRYDISGVKDQRYCLKLCLKQHPDCVVVYYKEIDRKSCILLYQRLHDVRSSPQNSKTNNAFHEYIRNCG